MHIEQNFGKAAVHCNLIEVLLVKFAAEVQDKNNTSESL